MFAVLFVYVYLGINSVVRFACYILCWFDLTYLFMCGWSFIGLMLLLFVYAALFRDYVWLFGWLIGFVLVTCFLYGVGLVFGCL